MGVVFANVVEANEQIGRVRPKHPIYQTNRLIAYLTHRAGFLDSIDGQVGTVVSCLEIYTRNGLAGNTNHNHKYLDKCNAISI